MSRHDKAPDNRDKPPPAVPNDREERLRAALRANLRRRKQQARGRVTAPDDEVPSDG